jgi:AcrR family transcriptional regulator
MTTKEKIIDESLTLFSKKGYSGVTVREIAAAVGIKDSSLYKHFKSKRAIFDEIIETASQRMDNLSKTLHISEKPNKEFSEYLSNFSEDDIAELSKKVFLFYLEDVFVSRFRRMLTIEQYKSSDVSELYTKIFTESSITYQTELFSQLMKCGIFKESDPETAAFEFYSPLFLLITRFDNKPEQVNEALLLLEKCVRNFARIHSAEKPKK